MLESLVGIKLLYAPFKGSGRATHAVLGGEGNLVITGAATVMPRAKVGRLKVVAFADEQCRPNSPDIPSTGEGGLKGYRARTWFGIVSSSGTPREIVAALNQRIVHALGEADLRNRLISVGFDIQTQSPEAFGTFMADDRAAIAKVIKSAGLRFD